MADESPFLPDEDPEPEELPTPWGFRITLIAVSGYLIWRLIQGVVWVVERVF